MQEEKEPSTRMKHRAIICKNPDISQCTGEGFLSPTCIRSADCTKQGKTHHQASPRLGWGHFTRVGNDFPWKQGLQLLELLQERSKWRKRHARVTKKKGWMTSQHVRQANYLCASLKRNHKRGRQSEYSNENDHHCFLQRWTCSAWQCLKPLQTQDKNLHFPDLLRWTCVGQNLNGGYHLENRALMVRSHRPAVRARSSHSVETESLFQPVQCSQYELELEQGQDGHGSKPKPAEASVSERPWILTFMLQSVKLHTGRQSSTLKCSWF